MTEELYAIYTKARANFWTTHDRLVSEGVSFEDMLSHPDYEDAEILTHDAYAEWLKAAIARDKAALAD